MTELYNNDFSHLYVTNAVSKAAGAPPPAREASTKRIKDILDEVEIVLRTKYEMSTRRVYLSRLNQLRLFVTDVLGSQWLNAEATALNGIAADFLKHLHSERAITNYTYNNYVSFLSLVAIIAGQQLQGLQRNYQSTEPDNDRGAKTFLSEAEIASCLQAARSKGCKRTELLLTLMLHSGLSLRGCLDLRVEDFIAQPDCILIEVQRKHTTKAIRLPLEAGTLLNEWLQQRLDEGIDRENPLVFPGRTGTLSNTAAEWSLRSIGWRLGLCLSPKVLRRTFRHHTLSFA
jgi:integrase